MIFPRSVFFFFFSFFFLSFSTNAAATERRPPFNNRVHYPRDKKLNDRFPKINDVLFSVELRPTKLNGAIARINLHGNERKPRHETRSAEPYCEIINPLCKLFVSPAPGIQDFSSDCTHLQCCLSATLFAIDLP